MFMYLCVIYFSPIRRTLLTVMLHLYFHLKKMVLILQWEKLKDMKFTEAPFTFCKIMKKISTALLCKIFPNTFLFLHVEHYNSSELSVIQSPLTNLNFAVFKNILLENLSPNSYHKLEIWRLLHEVLMTETKMA